jgi:hypothetical protein
MWWPKITPHVSLSILMNFSWNFRKIFVKFSQNFCEIFAKFSQNFRETKFREILWKSSHFSMIFAFSRKLKNAFSFQPYWSRFKELVPRLQLASCLEGRSLVRNQTGFSVNTYSYQLQLFVIRCKYPEYHF